MNQARFVQHAGCLLICLFIFLVPLRASALTLDDVNYPDEELTAQNWETRDVNTTRAAFGGCKFVSVLASAVWNGFGHCVCQRDYQSAIRLSIMQGTSLAMLSVALIMGTFSHDDKALSATWKSLFHYAVTLYATGYLMDVIGAFKGDSFILSDNHIDPYGHSVGLKLRWLPSDDFNLGIQLAYTYRSQRFWVTPYFYIDNLADFGEFYGAVDTGVALWAGERSHTYLALAIDAKFDQHQQEDHVHVDYPQLKLIPYLELSLDMGTWFEHLANIRFVNRLGVGVQLYNFKSAEMQAFSDYDTVLVLETAISMNLIKELNMALTYRYRPDFTVGQLSAPSVLNDTPGPGVGIFSLDLDVLISDGWSASLEANFGSSIDFWFGVKYHI